jgi:hypothetical protein
VVGKEWNSQIPVNFPITFVPKRIGRKAKVLGLKHLQFPAMSASGGPPDGGRVVHHWTEELLKQQNTISDG